MFTMAEQVPERLRPVTFAASTGHGIEYGVGFYAADDVNEDGGADGDCYGDLITMVDENADAPAGRVEQAQAQTMAFAEEVCLRWNTHPDLLAALEAVQELADDLRAAVEYVGNGDAREDAIEAALLNILEYAGTARAAIRAAREGHS